MPPIMIPEFPKGRSISYREKQDSEFLWRGTVTSAKRVKDRDYFVYTVQLLTKNMLVPASPPTYSEPF